MSATMSSTVEAFSRADRSGIGICLSGGGFRASLFHLGAVRRLHELGVLQKARWISSVSGGSILTGHLYNVKSRVAAVGSLISTTGRRMFLIRFAPLRRAIYGPGL